MEKKEFLLELLFPKHCLNCQKEGAWLCSDCASLSDVNPHAFCPSCRPPKIVADNRTCPYCKRKGGLNGLFSACSWQNFVVRKIISQYKYEPFVKELAQPLSSLILQHLKLLDYPPAFLRDRAGFVLVPVPLQIKRLKWRGFNQAEEIGKILTQFIKIPFLSDVLQKTKETPPQMELSADLRQENIKGVFMCQNVNLIINKKILLLDDVYTTGSTMNECSRVLRQAGAKEVWGITVARE
jgi:ComF family protein